MLSNLLQPRSLALVLLTLAPPLSAAALYSVTQIPVPVGASEMSARGINGSGQVTGDSGGRAFLFSGGVTNYLNIPESNSVGTAINDNGQVVGYSYSFVTELSEAFLYSNGTTTDLGPGIANSINDRGQVTGQDAAGYAFLYSNGTKTDLGTLGGATSIGYGINNAGQVTGVSTLPNNTDRHAFLYANGSMKDLGTLPGDRESGGYAVNNAGQVTGYSFRSGAPHAFLYSNGVMTDLGLPSQSPPPSQYYLGATGGSINNNGQVAGYLDLHSFEHPFVYSDGSIKDLNDMGLVDTSLFSSLWAADGINDNGQIIVAGRGLAPDYGYFSYILTPTAAALPEPDSFVLCGVTLLGAWVLRRYRRE